MVALDRRRDPSPLRLGRVGGHPPGPADPALGRELIEAHKGAGTSGDGASPRERSQKMEETPLGPYVRRGGEF